uniref:Uncharacterized protein n=1 Tax=viral metagenome TaxID=1070528 RepID=A0A6H1ZM44_9ZZZZ
MTYTAAADLFTQANQIEFWGMNNLMRILREVWILADRWFDIHHPDWIMKCKERRLSSPELYVNATIPIYMMQHFEQFPSSVAYPIKEIMAYYRKPENFFNATASLMLALALAEERFEQINICGVDMWTSDEYQRHKPPMYYLLGIAEERGIEVVIPPNSMLLHTKEKSYFGMNGEI